MLMTSAFSTEMQTNIINNHHHQRRSIPLHRRSTLRPTTITTISSTTKTTSSTTKTTSPTTNNSTQLRVMTDFLSVFTRRDNKCGSDRRCVNTLTPHDYNHTQLGGTGRLCPPPNPRQGSGRRCLRHHMNATWKTATARSSTGSSAGNVEPTITIMSTHTNHQ